MDKLYSLQKPGNQSTVNHNDLVTTIIEAVRIPMDLLDKIAATSYFITITTDKYLFQSSTAIYPFAAGIRPEMSKLLIIFITLNY